MRNKIEFENRVREIAAQKKVQKATRFKVVKRATIACASLAAACLVVVMLTKISMLFAIKMNDKGIAAGSNPMAEAEPSLNKGDAMSPEEDAGMDGIMDSENESIHMNNGSQIVAKEVVLLIGSEKYALNDALTGRMSSWLDKVKNAPLADEYDSTGKIVYEVYYFYDGMKKVYYITENFIKLDEGEWFEFNQELREEFDEIVKKCREK